MSSRQLRPALSHLHCPRCSPAHSFHSGVLASDDGTAEMQAIANPIREGSEGFLFVQYRSIARLSAVVASIIFVSYLLRPASAEHGVDSLGSITQGVVATLAFAVGALASAAVGYVSMWVSARANIRVASAARSSFSKALLLCFDGGAFSALLGVGACVTGVSMLYAILHLVFAGVGGVTEADVPMLTVGYGFGASFVALFMQLGGGIYTKAADVGADMVGKIEAGIPEDDPRNPAVIADLVGDMVGDCVGSSADVFESVAAEIIGAMILGGSLAKQLGTAGSTGIVLFPIVLHGLDLAVSVAGIHVVRRLLSHHHTANENPVALLRVGFVVSSGLGILALFIACRLMLYMPTAPTAWLNFVGCGVTGIACSVVFILSTQYYTDYEYPPVQAIAAASTTGHGTNIITGVAEGMKSTAVPILTVGATVIINYWLGHSAGLPAEVAHNAGLYGTAVGTMGMLSTAGFVLAMNNYGPIADNAGGIVEMSEQPDAVRDVTDRLDAAGNVTKAATKGYSIGSAALACFLMFGALLDEFTLFAGQPFNKVDLAVPEVLVGGLMGVMMVFYFVGLSVSAVGRTAAEVVAEVRSQLRSNPAIMTKEALPDYKRCVSIVTQAALREMRLPGLLAVGAPIGIGLLFRIIGGWTGRPMLGAEVLCSFLMFATAAGLLMALFLDNVGGAWDNAKKYIEAGAHGGKGSEAHKASVTGDTVGDPFKDTAGPALHVVIKLLSTTILVLGPLFVQHV